MYPMPNIELSKNQTEIVKKIIAIDLLYLRTAIPIEKFKNYIYSSSEIDKSTQNEIIELLEFGSMPTYFSNKENKVAQELFRNKLKKSYGMIQKVKSVFFAISDKER